MCASGVITEKNFDGGGDVLGPHQRLADQDGPGAGAANQGDVVMRLDAALGHDKPIKRDQRGKLLRDFQSNVEGSQVPVVNAQDARAGLDGEIVSRLRQRTWGVAGAALGVDALPLVWWITPAAWGRAVVFGCAGACVAAGGVLAALVAAEIASHARPEGAENA